MTVKYFCSFICVQSLSVTLTGTNPFDVYSMSWRYVDEFDRMIPKPSNCFLL